MLLPARRSRGTSDQRCALHEGGSVSEATQGRAEDEIREACVQQ
jgi:hypothetical protein